MTQLLSTARRAGQLARIGLAARKLRRAQDDHERLLARQRLSELLSDARGIPMKVGQFLADREGNDPLRRLTQSIDPLPLERIVPEVEAQLGQPLSSVFARFEPSVAAASLGQVHRARLLNGDEVAVKVRYPGIQTAVRSELDLAGLMPSAGPVRKWGFDLDAYKRTLHDNIERELDYLDEASRQQRFGEHIRVDGLVVPRVHVDHCRSGLLTQDFEAGEDLEAARGYPRGDRLQLGRVLLESLFAGVFREGLVHGDPHAGNYRFRRGQDGRAQVVLYDYGCTIDIESGARLALLQLVVRLREGGELRPLQAFAAMGFDVRKLAPIQDDLHDVAAMLLEPFMQDGAFDTRDWRLSERMATKLGELRWWFRAAGPAHLLLLLRAFHGLALQLEALDVRLPWWPLLKRACGPALIEQARNHALPWLPGDAPANQNARSLARLMRVAVDEQGREPVRLSMPAREALHLDEIVPEDVRRRLELAGKSVESLQARVTREGLVPQVLFELHERGRDVRVWLE